MQTIIDLMPNEHILNFYEAVILPTWLPETLSLMVGAGDLDHDDIPNVEKFSTFDVFFCNAWDNNGSFRKNVEHIIRVYRNKKVICVIDHEQVSQVNRFVELFRGRFSLIDGHLGHTPHFTLSNLQKLLANGGRAMNIYERSETVIEVDEMIYWFDHGHFKRGYSDIELTSSMYKNGCGNVTEDDRNLMRLRFLTKIEGTYDPQGLVRCDLNLYQLSLVELQVFLYCLQMNKELPINMKGVFGYNKRVWRTEPLLELVLTKEDPYYGHDKIAVCREPELKARAEYIIQAIKDDIEGGYLSISVIKYKTLMKHLTSPKFEAACAAE